MLRDAGFFEGEDYCHAGAVAHRLTRLNRGEKCL